MFGTLLIEDLREHGEALTKQYGRRSPKIATPDFEKGVQAGLFPDRARYADWINMKKASEKKVPELRAPDPKI
jgi:hypothetical protein